MQHETLKTRLQEKQRIPAYITAIVSFLLLIYYCFPMLFTLNEGVKNNIIGFKALSFYLDEAVDVMKYGGTAIVVALVFIILGIGLGLTSLSVYDSYFAKIKYVNILPLVGSSASLITAFVFFPKHGQYSIHLGFGLYLLVIVSTLSLIGLIISYPLTNKK